MNPIERTVVERLLEMGLAFNTIPAFLRNLVHTIDGTPHMSLKEINRRMEFLGWGSLELDDYTLQLIVACFEYGSELNSAGALHAATGPDKLIPPESMSSSAPAL